MKHIFLFLLPVLAWMMISCEEQAQSTPTLQASQFLIRTSIAGVCDTISGKDTLQVGDTVLMGVIAYGNFNCLTGLEAKADTSCMDLAFIWNHDDDPYLTDGSDPENGILLFVPQQINVCVTTLRYIPLKSGAHRVNLTVSSDAGANFSPHEYYFDAVVK